MKKKKKFLLLLIFSFTSAWAHAELPSRYTALLPYVQQAPDQGRSGTCLYVSSTGARELLANKREGITNPGAYGPFDFSESWLIKAPEHPLAKDKFFTEKQVLKFNWGYGIPAKEWDFDPWNGTRSSRRVWRERDWSGMTKVPLPPIETKKLFSVGDRWSMKVLNDLHVERIKEALWEHESPVLVTYNDNNFWHAILIVGYDDNIPGNCYQTPKKECDSDMGSFYVRDSFGLTVDLRDYDWFRFRGNSAIIVKEVGND